MRIAVYHALPPGGARRLVSETIRRSSRLHDFDLYTLHIGDGSDQRGDADLEGHVRAVHRAGIPWPAVERVTAPTPLRIPGAVANLSRAERRIAAQIDAGGYDLCWVHPSQYVQAPFLLRHLRTPSLYYVHEPRRQSFEAGAYRSPYIRRALPRRALSRSFEEYLRRADRTSTAAATNLVCNSHFTAEAVLRAYGREAWVCHPGVDDGTFRPGEGVAPTSSYVLAVGALHWLKRHELAIDAVSRITRDRPEVVVVYDREVDGYAERLRERAARLGVALHLRRDVPDATLVDLYRGALTTLCVSQLEPFGLTALESMSAGTPVVAVAEGGFRETVTHGVNGLLVPPFPDDVAAAIEMTRRGAVPRDPDAIRSTVVPRFSWDSTVRRLHEVFALASGTTQR
ncbi:MAG TPA: glycosyltransferase family 4 protein [Candidatus Dormibacteraeota bacterium]|nr:glycosyltransferase family 4 protein [Candidatus Dormibacteraeota bacterium]